MDQIMGDNVGGQHSLLHPNAVQPPQGSHSLKHAQPKNGGSKEVMSPVARIFPCHTRTERRVVREVRLMVGVVGADTPLRVYACDVCFVGAPGRRRGPSSPAPSCAAAGSTRPAAPAWAWASCTARACRTGPRPWPRRPPRRWRRPRSNTAPGHTHDGQQGSCEGTQVPMQYAGKQYLVAHGPSPQARVPEAVAVAQLRDVVRDHQLLPHHTTPQEKGHGVNMSSHN